MKKKTTPATVTIDTKLLARLIDTLEARIPEPTVATHIASYQLEANDKIERDRSIVDQARHLLRPKHQSHSEKWMALSLEEMRFARDVAMQQGNTARAFELATAIDRKRGFY